MKISLTQKEIGYLLYLINESLAKKTDTRDSFEDENVNDIELIGKLEQALRFLDVKKLGIDESTIKEKPLN